MNEPAYKYDFCGRLVRSEHKLLRIMAESVGLKDLHRAIVWDEERGLAHVTIGTRKFRAGFSPCDDYGEKKGMVYLGSLAPIS